MDHPLNDTLERLRAHKADLNCPDLAGRTALPEDTVAALLRGEDPPADTIEDRVCARIKTLADAHLTRTQKRSGDLVTEVHEHLGISKEWARKLLKGEKMPNVPLLHGIADFFNVAGGEAFFTAPPADALNRELQTVLFDLDVEADPAQKLADLGVRSMAGRSPKMGHGDLVELAKMVASIANDLKTVHTKLERLEKPEADR